MPNIRHCPPAEPLPLTHKARQILRDLPVRSKRPFYRHQIRHLLVRSVNWLGDAVLSLPALQNLRLLFPHARITVAALPRVAPLFQPHPAVDAVISLPPHPPATPWRQWLAAMKALGRQAFDLAVILPNSFGSALEAVVAGIPHRLGYARLDRSLLLTQMVYKSPALGELHQVYHYLGLLRACGWPQLDGFPQICLLPEEKQEALAWLQAQGWRPGQKLVGLAPGAAYGPAKQWPPDRFAAVADYLIDKFGAFCVILGGAPDQQAARAVMAAMNYPALNLTGQTGLRQALALLSHLQLLVTNDSGLMHAAAALWIPVVAIFGSTNPATTGPFTPLATVIRHPQECSPCLARTCSRGYPCLTAVSVAEVAAAAAFWLGEEL